MKLAAVSVVFAGLALAQSVPEVVVPETCTGGFSPGKSVVLYRTPYTFDQVISVIGNFKNLTWSINPPSTVTLNGTNNQVGTGRFYNLNGLNVTETIIYYKRTNDFFHEVHNAAQLALPPVKFYIPHDSNLLRPVCGGMAAEMNFTALFCANDVAGAKKGLDMIHHQNAVRAEKMLGGNQFTSCSALQSMEGSAVPGPAHAPVSMLGASITVATAVIVVAMLLS